MWFEMMSLGPTSDPIGKGSLPKVLQTTPVFYLALEISGCAGTERRKADP